MPTLIGPHIAELKKRWASRISMLVWMLIDKNTFGGLHEENPSNETVYNNLWVKVNCKKVSKMFVLISLPLKMQNYPRYHNYSRGDESITAPFRSLFGRMPIQCRAVNPLTTIGPGTIKKY